MSAIDLFKAFATDTEREVKGTEVVIPEFGNVKWRIARANNEEYNKLFLKLYTENKAILDDSSTPEAKERGNAKAKELMATCLATTILVGWEGEIPFNGEKLAYSVENAKRLLELPELAKRFLSRSEDFNLYRLHTESEEKN